MSARSKERSLRLPKSRTTLWWSAWSQSKNDGHPIRPPSGRLRLSTLITRAPTSLRTLAHSGPAHNEERSTTVKGSPRRCGAGRPVNTTAGSALSAPAPPSGRSTATTATGTPSNCARVDHLVCRPDRGITGQRGPGPVTVCAGRRARSGQGGPGDGRHQFGVLWSSQTYGHPPVGGGQQTTGPASRDVSSSGQAHEGGTSREQLADIEVDSAADRGSRSDDAGGDAVEALEQAGPWPEGWSTGLAGQPQHPRPRPPFLFEEGGLFGSERGGVGRRHRRDSSRDVSVQAWA